MATFPGLPALPDNIALAAETVLLVVDAVFFSPLPGVPQWGIFLDGVPVVIADSVVTFDYRKDSRISNYQVEQGGFESYNKVENPYLASVRFATGGGEANRQAMLDSIDAVARSLDLYDVVTPERVYESANVVMQDYRRTSKDGVGLIQVDVRLEEVRVSSSSTFSNTQSPSGVNIESGGNVSPSEPTATQESQIPDVQ